MQRMRIDFQLCVSFLFQSAFVQRRILHHRWLQGSGFGISVGVGFKCLVHHLEQIAVSRISDRHPVLKPKFCGPGEATL